MHVISILLKEINQENDNDFNISDESLSKIFSVLEIGMSWPFKNEFSIVFSTVFKLISGLAPFFKFQKNYISKVF